MTGCLKKTSAAAADFHAADGEGEKSMCENLNSASRCRYAQRLAHYVLFIVVLTAGWLANVPLFAAPITFHFDATISSIQGDVQSLNLPFSLNVGQQFTGKYSFASEEDLLDLFLNPGLGKQGTVSLILDGTEIEAVTNFGQLNSGYPAEIDGPPPIPSSSISLGYLSPTDVIPGTGPGLLLVGPEGTISDPRDVLDINIWNQLDLLRRLELQFGYPNTVTVRATIGDFLAVPEPSSAKFLFLLAVLGSTYCVRDELKGTGRILRRRAMGRCQVASPIILACRRTMRDHLRWFIFLVGVVLVPRASLQAAPVTLRFDATVGPPRQGAQEVWLPAWNFLLTRERTGPSTDVEISVARGDLEVKESLTIRGVYNATSVAWRAGAAADKVFELYGDFSTNLTVDSGDYVLYRRQQNMTGSGLWADGDENGTVNNDDYLIYISHFGNTLTLLNVV